MFPSSSSSHALLQAAFLDPRVQGHAVLFVLALQLPCGTVGFTFRAQACYQTRRGSVAFPVWFWGSYTSFLSGFSSDQWE